MNTDKTKTFKTKTFSSAFLSGSSAARMFLSVGLRQDDDEFGLWVGQIAGDIRREIAGALDGVPGRAGLGQGEILEVELDGDGAGRLWHVGQGHAGQGLAHQVFDV